MKTLKLDHDLADLIRTGKKNSTWRINDDKDISVNDQVGLIDKVDPKDKSTWYVFGIATVDRVVMKRLGEVAAEDFDAHESYSSPEKMYEAYRKYYGPDIGPNTAVKIIHFSYKPYEEQKSFEMLDDPNLGAKEIKLFADGGSRGNPGPSASGYVLLDMDDNVIMKSGVYLGITTNNQAEYQALKYGLEAAKKFGAREVQVFMDSLLVVNQMKGIFKVKNRDLWPIYEAIKEQAQYFKKVTYTHVPRELNKLADAEVNTTLDAELGK
jgi:ribonuclease HI